METDLDKLRIHRPLDAAAHLQSRTRRWALRALTTGLLVASAYLLYAKLDPPHEVEVVRIPAPELLTPLQDNVTLNATGYVVAAHKIEVASKVVGRVAWIGLEKGDQVRDGQVLVRLEDDEYRARVAEAQGQLASVRARLAELELGSRPEEIARAAADLELAWAELNNARVTLERTQALAEEGIVARQALDDVRARYAVQTARAVSLERTHELIRLGPRYEQIDAARGQVSQAEGVLAFAQTQLENTVIRAPVSGTVLERNVEKGEFVTTGFVGDRGAKGYVASLADLRDLEVELDISQNDFAQLEPRQPASITTDAYPDRKYDGYLSEISPEANRQKATVQVKVKITQPDEYLRPDMNANVAFLARAHAAAALRNGAVFVVVNDKAVRRAVRVAGASMAGSQIAAGLTGGEDLIVNPPSNLKDGDEVRVKEGL